MYTRALHLETATGSSLRVPPDWGAVAGWPLTGAVGLAIGAGVSVCIALDLLPLLCSA